jgi:pyruvate formate lyase activating enzyme
VLVSNGYITPEAAKDLYPMIDAANIDMKGFSEEFYTGLTKSHLQPVLDAIKYFHSLGNHLELTNLIIPGENNSRKMLDDYLDWLEENLDKNVPLHFSAYHPDHLYNKAPRTAPTILYQIKEIVNSRGFEHVYLGNI